LHRGVTVVARIIVVAAGGVSSGSTSCGDTGRDTLTACDNSSVTSGSDVSWATFSVLVAASCGGCMASEEAEVDGCGDGTLSQYNK